MISILSDAVRLNYRLPRHNSSDSLSARSSRVISANTSLSSQYRLAASSLRHCWHPEACRLPAASCPLQEIFPPALIRVRSNSRLAELGDAQFAPQILEHNVNLSFGKQFLRVRPRILRAPPSLNCFFWFIMWRISSGSSPP